VTVDEKAIKDSWNSSCEQSSMLHGSESWPVRNENEVAIQWAEMRMVRWTCGVKLSKELRDRDRPETPKSVQT